MTNPVLPYLPPFDPKTLNGKFGFLRVTEEGGVQIIAFACKADDCLYVLSVKDLEAP